MDSSTLELDHPPKEMEMWLVWLGYLARDLHSPVAMFSDLETSK